MAVQFENEDEWEQVDFTWEELIESIEKSADVDSRKVLDDSLRYNAENASGAGLEVRVTREYDEVGLSGGRECQWCIDRCCTDLPYREAYDRGAFERHPGCRCTIEYVSARGVKTYQTGKSSPNNWISEDEFNWRVNYGLATRVPTPEERVINAAIEMQVRDKSSLTLANAIVENHDALQYYSPESMAKRLERAGYEILPLSQSKSGFNGLSLADGGGFKVQFGGDGLFRYHPPGGIHGKAYWSVSSSRTGVRRYGMDGSEFIIGE